MGASGWILLVLLAFILYLAVTGKLLPMAQAIKGVMVG